MHLASCIQHAGEQNTPECRMVDAACLFIALAGRTGSGKTTLAYALARHLPFLKDALIIGNDEVRRAILGLPLAVDMPPESYADEISAEVESLIAMRMKAALQQNRSVINHAGFFGAAAQERIQAFARANAQQALGIWLDVPDNILKARVQKRLDERANGQDLSIEAGHASDADLVVLLEKFQDYHVPTDAFWHKIDASQPLPTLIQTLTRLIAAQQDRRP